MVHPRLSNCHINGVRGVGTAETFSCVKKKTYPCNRLWRPEGFWDVEVPIFCRQSAHSRAVRVSPLRAGRPLSPRKIPGTHFC
jgi:hypothetical protein